MPEVSEAEVLAFANLNMWKKIELQKSNPARYNELSQALAEKFPKESDPNVSKEDIDTMIKKSKLR